MAETLVKNPTCSECGEEARPQALFCFACGGEIIDLPLDDEGNVSSAWFKEEIVESDQTGGMAAGTKKAEEEPQEDTLEAPDDEFEGESFEAEENVNDDEPSPTVTVNRRKRDDLPDKKEEQGRKMTAASELRKRPKPVRTKRVEVVWEEKTDAPNWLFIVFGLLLGLVGLALFFLAFYLK